MDFVQGKYPIISKITLAKEIYDFTILCPEVTVRAHEGQFVHILADGFSLRRPISICGIDREKGTMRVVFEVRGSGTKEIAKLNEGDLMDVIAPLGKGFSLDKSMKVITVGGGIGTPPMLSLAEFYGENCVAINGFRSASAVILQEDFKAAGAKTVLCTDDGTAGRKGFVTAALEEELRSCKADMIYACGPHMMLKGVVEIADKFGIRCEVSLEQRMGCGVGACLVCACKTVKDGREYMAHVCKDGPVFDSKEVVL